VHTPGSAGFAGLGGQGAPMAQDPREQQLRAVRAGMPRGRAVPTGRSFEADQIHIHRREQPPPR